MTESELIQKILDELSDTESEHSLPAPPWVIRVIAVMQDDSSDSLVGPILTRNDNLVPQPSVIVTKTSNGPMLKSWSDNVASQPSTAAIKTSSKSDGFYTSHYNLFLLTSAGQLIRQHQSYCISYDLRRKQFTWAVYHLLNQWVVDRPIAGDLRVVVSPLSIGLIKDIQTKYPNLSIPEIVEMGLRKLL